MCLRYEGVTELRPNLPARLDLLFLEPRKMFEAHIDGVLSCEREEGNYNVIEWSNPL